MMLNLLGINSVLYILKIKLKLLKKFLKLFILTLNKKVYKRLNPSTMIKIGKFDKWIKISPIEIRPIIVIDNIKAVI